MAYAEGADYVPLLRRAFELWGSLEEASGQRLVTTTGGLMLGPLDGTIVGGALESAQVHGLAHELLDAAEVRRRFPTFVPADGDVGLFEEVAGLVRPEAAIATYLRLAGEAGADLRYGTAVTGWRATADGVVVTTRDGEHSAARLVIAPGAWAPELLADLTVPFTVHRRVQHYWATMDQIPVWIWEYAPGIAAYGLPNVDGTGAKAALHHGHDPVDPNVGAADATGDEIAAMRDWLAIRMPALAESGWLANKPCLYTLTPDEHFVLGRHPVYDAVAIAGGFSGHGYKFTPIVGEILADLALTGTTRYPIGLFDPARFAA